MEGWGEGPGSPFLSLQGACQSQTETHFSFHLPGQEFLDYLLILARALEKGVCPKSCANFRLTDIRSCFVRLAYLSVFHPWVVSFNAAHPRPTQNVLAKTAVSEHLQCPSESPLSCQKTQTLHVGTRAVAAAVPTRVHKTIFKHQPSSSASNTKSIKYGSLPCRSPGREAAQAK